MSQDAVRIVSSEEIFRTAFSAITVATIDHERFDGGRQTIRREMYDHGNGAGILLYDKGRDCVLLVRQFRYPAYANPPTSPPPEPRGWLIEVPAGMVDDHHQGLSAAEAIRREAEEEAGVRVADPHRVLDVFMSPGSVSERVTCFVARYTAGDRIGPGGGVPAECEDLALMEVPFATALQMVEDGEIVDAKTVMLLYWAALHRDAL